MEGRKDIVKIGHLDIHQDVMHGTPHRIWDASSQWDASLWNVLRRLIRSKNSVRILQEFGRNLARIWHEFEAWPAGEQRIPRIQPNSTEFNDFSLPDVGTVGKE